MPQPRSHAKLANYIFHTIAAHIVEQYLSVVSFWVYTMQPILPCDWSQETNPQFSLVLTETNATLWLCHCSDIHNSYSTNHQGAVLNVLNTSYS